MYLCLSHTCHQPFKEDNNSVTYLFYGAHKRDDMQRNVCRHMGTLSPRHVQFKSTSPFLDCFLKEVKVQMFTLHRECCSRGCCLTLALTSFMRWPSVTLSNPNSLFHPSRFVLSPALKRWITSSCVRQTLNFRFLTI